jgi:phospho-N-acetylmuramoyl-pentapeptide-transferase
MPSRHWGKPPLAAHKGDLMLYHWLYPLASHFPLFNVLKYITFRSAGAALTAMAIWFICGKSFIKALKRIQKHGQPIRNDGPETHLLEKKGTPTMGGALIIGSMVISTLLWGNLSNGYLWTVLFVAVAYAALGSVDDLIKLTHRNAKGMRSRTKFLAQILIGGIAAVALLKLEPHRLATGLTVPFFKDVLIPLGSFFIPFVLAVIVGSSNAVNLTDGLDGLAIVPVMTTAMCFAIISYLVGHHVFSHYLQLHHIPGAGEIAVFCGAMVGASLGFLWFNAPPAMVFMGDTGSLALGASLGVIALITKHELVLFIIGGLFVMETISVILQVLYFKLTGGKRIFLMAPIHHHFEKKGWKEPTVVIRFWIISFILALIGMMTLKLR